MAESGLPELLRTDLQETCLAIKAQGFTESVSSFLAAAIEPPAPEAVAFAVENLKATEAFTADEKMTALGGILAKLPVHPTLGKMILLGLIFRCLDPMIIIGSLQSERALFVKPLGSGDQWKASKQHFNVAESDHIIDLKAFQYLRDHSRAHTDFSVRQAAAAYLIHHGAFRSASQTTKQVAEVLASTGLLDGAPTKDRNTPQIGGDALNVNSQNFDLIKCLVLAGMHPNLAATFRADTRALRTASKRMVLHHPSSVNAPRKKDEPPTTRQIYAFTTLARLPNSDTYFMRDSSLVTPLAAMLFGGHLNKESTRLVMDNWLPFVPDTPFKSAHTDTIMRFRSAKDRMLNGVFKLFADPQRTGAAVNAMDIITEGLVKALEADSVAREREKAGLPQQTQIQYKTPQEGTGTSIPEYYRPRNMPKRAPKLKFY